MRYSRRGRPLLTTRVWQKSVLPIDARLNQRRSARYLPSEWHECAFMPQMTSQVIREPPFAVLPLTALMIISRQGIVRGVAGERGRSVRRGPWNDGGTTMPWVVRDAVDEINRAVGRRWQGLDRLLPFRAELPEGCARAAADHRDRGAPRPARTRRARRPRRVPGREPGHPRGRARGPRRRGR